MKIYSISLLMLVASASALANAAETGDFRDPFWPVGYAPAKPEPEKPVEEPEPVIIVEEKPKPPPPRPITPQEWKMARKLLKITGYALANKTEGSEEKKTSIVIINRKHYQSGDMIKITRQDVEFIWRVGEIGNNSIDLIQEKATRLKKGQEVKPRAAPALNPQIEKIQ